MGTDETMESELGLGELAGLTVANEADSLAYDVSSKREIGSLKSNRRENMQAYNNTTCSIICGQFIVTSCLDSILLSNRLSGYCIFSVF